MKKSLTILDIAKKANVSPSAVSIALNNRKGISEKTRERILQIVEKYNYVPNQQARRLLFKCTNNIGILHEEHRSPLRHLFLMEVLSSALTKSEQLGYNLLISSVNGERYNQIPDVVKNRDVDGIIIIGEMNLQIIDNIRSTGIPTVLVDDHMRSKDTIAVEVDHVQGAELAVDYLISCGHTKIGYIGETQASMYGKQTYYGFKRSLKKNKLPLVEKWLRFKAANGDEKSGERCAAELAAECEGDVPTALYCAADIYAIGVIRQLQAEGYTVPDDISVISMDNVILSKYIQPPLTTIKFDMAKMGEFAIETIIDLIQGDYTKPNKVFFAGELIKRKSVKQIDE